MHATVELTVHAVERQQQRNVPPSVVQALQTSATRYVGHRVGGVRVEYRIVRHGRTFWIAPVTAGEVATMYSKDESEIRSWARTYLLNPEQSACRLLRLASHRTPAEAVTDELASLWLGEEHRQSASGRLDA